MKKREYRVVTADICVFADSPEDAKDAARADMGGRVHAVETGIVSDEDEEDEP